MFAVLFREKRLFTTIILALTVVVFFVIIVVSSILYANFERVGRSLIHSAAKESLVQASHSINLMSESAKNTALQVYYDPELSKLLFFPDVSSAEVNRAIMQLDNYRNPTYSFIHSIYLFNRLMGSYFLTSPADITEVNSIEGFFDEELTKILNNIQQYKKFSIIPRKIQMPLKNKRESVTASVYSFIFYENTSGEPINSAVVINISEEWMREIMDSLNIDPSNDTFIIDSEGTTVSSTNKEPMLTNISGREYVQRILESSSPSGFFIDAVDGEKSLITYVTFTSLRWKFVRIIPYHKIISKVNRMRLDTILIAFGILICGLTLSYIISKKLYKPIEILQRRSRLLEKEKTKNFTVNRTRLLKDILAGKYGDDLEEVETAFSEYRVELNPEGGFRLGLIEIDNFFQFCKEHGGNVRDTIKNDITNALTGLCRAFSPAEIFNLENDNIVLILQLSKPDAELYEKVKSSLEKTQSMIHRKYGITISATISSIAYGIEELNRLYEEVLEFSNYRMFQGKGCIIKADAVRVKPADEYSYPVVKEKELIDALMLGNMDRAEELLLQIIEETAGYPYTILNLAVLRIFTAIHNATHIIRKHNNITAHLNLGTLMADIKRCETVEDIIQQFHRVFQTITAYVEQVKNNKHEDLIHKVSVIISEKFSDPNLSLNYIADSVNLSAAYLGRLIKKTKSESVSDMINNYRLDKAKELLEKTQHPVHAITETIGITNEPYFYTLFKKKFGVTPNEYRRNIYPESIP